MLTPIVDNGVLDTECLTPTVRPTVPAMEKHMLEAYRVLDHGMLRVVDYMGNDDAICQAARTSYGKGTTSTSNNRGLINYLLSHGHTTPFEMCELKLHVKLPIFVARQWIRHRTANVNEYSARYSILDREFYVPQADQIQMQSTTNNQGREEGLTSDDKKVIRRHFARRNDDSYEAYLDLIKPQSEGGDFGLARELARLDLPPSIYTQWYWKVDLHNLFHFLRLRADPHAQYEIRVYAEAICELVKDWVPLAYDAWIEYQKEASKFSATEWAIIHELLARHPGAVKSLIKPDGMSERQWSAFMGKIS